MSKCLGYVFSVGCDVPSTRSDSQQMPVDTDVQLVGCALAHSFTVDHEG